MDLATCSAYCFKIAGLFFVGERIHKYFLFLTANFFTGVQALSLSTTPLIVAMVIECTFQVHSVRPSPGRKVLQGLQIVWGG